MQVTKKNGSRFQTCQILFKSFTEKKNIFDQENLLKSSSNIQKKCDKPKLKKYNKMLRCIIVFSSMQVFKKNPKKCRGLCGTLVTAKIF